MADLRIIAAAALLVWPVAAWAGPMAPEQCAKVSADLAALDQAGVKALLEKGPAAAKGSLTREQREQVRNYLDLLGSARFRCANEAPLVTLRPEAPEDPAESQAAFAPIEAGSPGITLPPGVAAAVVAPIKPAVPKTPKAAGAAPGAATSAKPPAAKAQQPSPAAKAPPAVKPAPAKAPAAAAAAAPGGPPSAQPKPKAKAKVDDALRPTPPAGTPAAVAVPPQPAAPKAAPQPKAQ